VYEGERGKPEIEVSMWTTDLLSFDLSRGADRDPPIFRYAWGLNGA